ncbi:MAG: multi-sensor hybrid histidine kinase, partial [Planctomycetaceae bacterium]|nr:multi-sensor hybrid histidine kinase [Planctomycetaceae bacterium]
NLCINARDAMPQGGLLRISTEQLTLTKATCETLRHPTPGDTLLITVTDTGIGMSQDVLSRIFEPFFTTKDVGKGTGLGMAMVYGMVEQHGGSVHVESELGSGTTVSLYLPLVEPQQAAANDTTSDRRMHGNQLILIAEDEPLVASYAERVLQQVGYRTLLARDGVEAVEFFKRHSEAIALVLLDVVMPKLNGHQVCEQIRAIKPDLPILFCTGYDPDSSQTGFVAQRGESLLTKPYTAQLLLSTIADALDAVAQR